MFIFGKQHSKWQKQLKKNWLKSNKKMFDCDLLVEWSDFYSWLIDVFLLFCCENIWGMMTMNLFCKDFSGMMKVTCRYLFQDSNRKPLWLTIDRALKVLRKTKKKERELDDNISDTEKQAKVIKKCYFIWHGDFSAGNRNLLSVNKKMIFIKMQEVLN
jgi:hypothetical protein